MDKRILLTLLIVVSIFLNSWSQQLAFPSAEGFGAYAKGGRGGQVIYVTNLNDDGPGSLRQAVEQEGPRTVVFGVSGTIELKERLNIENPYLTIAGQTAPGDGICLKGETVKIRSHDIIIRYLRVRLGDGMQGIGSKQGKDAIDISEGKDIIIDHCSASWSLDESLSSSTRFPTLTNVTVQWCFITEGLNPDNHGFGSLIRGTGGAQYSYLHNLYAHNQGRNPRPGNYDTNPYYEDPDGLLLDFRNNVIYNWGGGHAGYNNDTISVTRLNYVGNYLIPGGDSEANGIAYSTRSAYNRAYFAGNYYDHQPTDNPWEVVKFRKTWTEEEVSAYKQTAAFEAGPINKEDAPTAYQRVLASGGASLPKRDSVDLRIVDGVRNGTGSIIKSQEEVGSWPILNSTPAPVDTDQDGMPDEWEKQNGLDPDNAADGNKVGKDGYTMLEEYLNSITFAPTEVPSNTDQYADYDFVVAADGSGDFTTVQEAIDAVPALRRNRTRIFIRNGVYKEKLVLPTTTVNVSLIGESVEQTILTFDDYASRKNRFGEDIGTSGSASFFLNGDGFSAKNITFENAAGPVGQAVAVRVDGDKVQFENCRFLGFQDTLYTHGINSRQYYKNCYIEGTVDFIFGSSTAVFDDCEINCKSPGYITAASTKEETETGYVFRNCKIFGEVKPASVYLGRPWRPYAKVIFYACELSDIIRPEGWDNWRNPENEKTAYYAEYQNTGVGAAIDQRVNWSHLLTEEEAAQYQSLELLLRGWDPLSAE
jgi:pectate lyase